MNSGKKELIMDMDRNIRVYIDGPCELLIRKSMDKLLA